MDSSVPGRNRDRFHATGGVEMTYIDTINDLQPLDISGCNGHYQRLVVDRIAGTGKALDELTIRELRQIIETAADDFNKDA